MNCNKCKVEMVSVDNCILTKPFDRIIEYLLYQCPECKAVKIGVTE